MLVQKVLLIKRAWSPLANKLDLSSIFCKSPAFGRAFTIGQLICTGSEFSFLCPLLKIVNDDGFIR